MRLPETLPSPIQFQEEQKNPLPQRRTRAVAESKKHDELHFPQNTPCAIPMDLLIHAFA